VGKITELGDSVQYQIFTNKDLAVIINHFDNFPLLTQKKADYELFKRVVDMMNRKEHLTLDGLKEIVMIRASLNRGLTDVLKVAFPNIIPAVRPIIKDQEIYDPHLLAGFASGECSFSISLTKSQGVKVGASV
jgi:hypothetical protein